MKFSSLAFVPYLFSVIVLGLIAAPAVQAQDEDPPQVAVGERLFLETRFAQYFEAHSHGDANRPLANGDPVMDSTITTDQPQPGPFAGQSMNCRACHLVDEQNTALGNRTYNDFARRSPVPSRIEDDHTVTLRNSPPLVNASLARSTFLLHFDAEFPSKRALVVGTMTGRNYGWLPGEETRARAHIAHIIRDDDGTGDLAADYGSTSYRKLFAADSSVPAEFRLPRAYRLNVDKATDDQILNLIGTLVGAYMDSLIFSKDEKGNYNGSSFDSFLTKNKLPHRPATGESAVHYGDRLLGLLNKLTSPTFVTPADGSFQNHTQDFAFGQTELDGLKIFLRHPAHATASATELNQGAIGNCAACHAPPNFTDFKFHNTGASQEEYDAVHGAGAFAQLTIPDYATRRADPDTRLPASHQHPFADGSFASIPDAQHQEYADLGLWNSFANPDRPLSQPAILRALTGGKPAPYAQWLPRTIALFKTPGLRDLTDSEPYLHTGGKDTLEDVISFYRSSSDLQRAGHLRNGAPELAGIALQPQDIAPLAAFLKSLTEDYN